MKVKDTRIICQGCGQLVEPDQCHTIGHCMSFKAGQQDQVAFDQLNFGKELPEQTAEEKLVELLHQHYPLLGMASKHYIAAILVTEAGYKSPEEVASIVAAIYEDFGTEPFEVKAKNKGYVKLADDQTLPVCLPGNRPRARAFRDMLHTGWRKIKQE